ncbi:hypothetical protein M9Y10_006284 [Tritrichomonas musculus]|uniref:UBR-type domain-containing protein n=1 Tax=Tritrichomonas musculus TaxID=1915356 RepID=A0ABR2JFG9_9EUKA
MKSTYDHISIPIDSKISLPEKFKLRFYDLNAKDSQPSNERIIKVELCTYTNTGNKMVCQKFFTCKTCRFTEDQCVCEVCARKCHTFHNISPLGFKEGYCSCGAGELRFRSQCNNKKLAQKPFVPGPCTINETGKYFKYQKFYKCLTCGFSENSGCCDACAKTCHLGHDLIYMGTVRSYCDCGYGEEPGCVPCKCVKAPNPNYQAPQ